MCFVQLEVWDEKPVVLSFIYLQVLKLAVGCPPTYPSFSFLPLGWDLPLNKAETLWRALVKKRMFLLLHLLSFSHQGLDERAAWRRFNGLLHRVRPCAGNWVKFSMHKWFTMALYTPGASYFWLISVKTIRAQRVAYSKTLRHLELKDATGPLIFWTMDLKCWLDK